MGAVGILIIMLLTLVAWLLVNSFSRALTALARATQRVAQDDLTARVPTKGSDELALLGQSFNTMVERISESRERTLQTEKMAPIGQLAGGVAHEINNPLAVILGFAQGMEKRVPEGDALRLPVASIAREALRCKELVQELLIFARTGKKTSEELDVLQVLESSSVLLESRAKTQEIEFVRDFDAAIPLI